MRRRELLVAATVLVPFTALVIAGFLFSAPTETPPGEHAVNAAPLPAPLPVVQAPPAAVDEGFDAGPPPPPALAPELAAPVTAVQGEVQRCFEDQHLRVRHDVTIHFTPTRDGGFERVVVGENNNPYLAACLEDVFAEVAFSPTGAETFRPAEHTFRFEPDGGAR